MLHTLRWRIILRIEFLLFASRRRGTDQRVPNRDAQLSYTLTHADIHTEIYRHTLTHCTRTPHKPTHIHIYF